jgi:hypothetical protein
VDADDDAEVYNLDMLDEELIQAHLEPEGDLVDDDTHQKVPFFPVLLIDLVAIFFTVVSRSSRVVEKSLCFHAASSFNKMKSHLFGDLIVNVA